MKHMLRLTVLMLLGLCVTSAFAQQIDEQTAMATARQFLNKSPRAKVRAKVESPLTLAYTCSRDIDEKVCFYVFNVSTDGGFVIIGGDEAAKDILGYSEDGAFDYNTIPANFKWWLSQYKTQISYAIDCEVESSNAKRKNAKRVASTPRADIGPLIQTKWNQDAPYNSSINAAFSAQNNGKSISIVTGCVATAIAQVLKHHQYPTIGKYNRTLASKNFTINGTACPFAPSADFASTTYDWGNMLNSYSNGYSDAQANAVGTLMYHCGVAVNMDYGTNASGAVSRDIPLALSKYFGYDKSVRYEQRKFFTDKAWEDMIYNELVNGRPVLYGGQASNGDGHQFICDGYRTSDGLYSFNWGWGGFCDGHYALTGSYAIKPNGSGIGGAGNDAAYTIDQDAIIGLKPDEGGTESPVLLEYETGTICIKDGSTSYSNYEYAQTGNSKTLTLYENIANYSSTLTTFKLGVRATDTTNGATYLWPMSSNSSLRIFYLKDFSIPFDLKDIPYNGTYAIQAVCRNVNSTSDDDWFDVRVSPSVDLPTVTITNAQDPAKTDLTFSISSNTVQVKRKLQISPDELYKGTVTYESSDESIATVDANGLITGKAIGNVTITANATETTYFNATTATFDIQVTELVKEDVTAEISSTEIVTGKTANITIKEGYDGTPIYESSNTSVATVEDGVVSAIATGTATITVTLPETELSNANTVTFDITVKDPEVSFYAEPYFCYNNNPWEEDMTLYVPFHNTTTETFSGSFYMSMHTKNQDFNFTMGMNGVPAQTKYVLRYDLSSLKSYFEEGVNTPFTISFYRDAAYADPFEYETITYTYRNTLNATVKANGYTTLILPIDAAIPDGMTVYSCNIVNADNVLELTEESSIKANTPYIIYNTGEDHTFTGPNVVDDNGIERYTSGRLVGLVKKATVPAGSYVLQTKNGVKAFYEVKNDATGQANRCYLTLPERVNGLYVKRHEDYTAIDTLSSLTSDEVQEIYTLNGTRVTSLQKGINIIKTADGTVRKVLVK